MQRSAREIEIKPELWERVDALASQRELSADQVIEAALIALFRKRPAPAAPAVEGEGVPEELPETSTLEVNEDTDPQARITADSEDAAQTRSARIPKEVLDEVETKATASATGGEVLYLHCEGEWHRIDQEQFVIGRGSRYSDLAIKDANISRRHCAIVRRDGAYYMKDLGSTNGVEFDGVKVDDHRIEEGHVYELCEHPLRFSYRDPNA